MKINSLFAFCLLLTCSFAFGQKTSETSLAAETRVQNESRDTYERNGTELGASFDANLVKAAILDQKAWVQIQGFDLELQTEKSSPGAVHYAFDQTYQGLPVYGHGIKAMVSKQGRIVHLLNNLKSSVAIEDLSFVQSETDIKTYLDQTYGSTGAALDVEISTCFFVDDQSLVPAFRAAYNYADSRWEEVLSATDGHLFRRRDLGSFHHSFLAMDDTTGTGLVFNPDPLTSSGNAYGSTNDWQDNSDADNAALNGQRVRVDLKDIEFTGGLFYLRGPYADLQDLEAPNTPIATSADGSFDFTRSQSGFEDVMVYYHIDTFQRYVQSIGFNNLYNSPLLLDPHGLNGLDNSHFVPSGGSSRLAFGEGCVDDAEDADVIIHEYGHALSFSAAPGTNSGTERLGLDEGIGDYVAASYSKASYYTFWKNTFTWDGHNECWDGRSASDPTAYPPNTTNIYVFGAIWASCLMEAHDQIGREASDRVFFQSLYSNFGQMTLRDAALVVLDADDVLYGGAHRSVYQDVFCSRGILSGASCLVSRTDPDAWAPNWHLFPNPAAEIASIQLEEYRPGAKYSYRMADLMGRVLLAGELGPDRIDLNLNGMAPGVYLVQIMDDGKAVAQRRLVVAP